MNSILDIFNSKLKKDFHLKELLAGSSIAFILRGAGAVFGYVLILLITRIFGADAMGIFALSTTVLSIFSIFGRLGMDTALLRFIAGYSSQGRLDMVKGVYIKSIKVLVPLCLLLSAMLYFLSPYISTHIFHKEYLTVYFKIVSLALLPLVLININSQALRALKKIKEFSFFQNISPYLFTSTFIVVMIFFSKKQSLPVVSYVLAMFAGAVMSHILWQRYSRIGIGYGCSDIKLKDMLNVSLPMMLSGSMFFIMQWTDTIMLGMFRTEAEVGVYNVALKVSAFTSIMLFAVNSIAAPKFAEFYGKNDVAGIGKIARQSTRLIFWTSIPVLLVIFLLPDFILGLFGTDFKAGIVALLILTAGQFVNAISGSVGFILQMTGREKVFQYIILSATALNIIMNIFLIPLYGINGAAVANMVSMIFWNLSSVIYIKASMNINTLYVPVLIRH